MADLKARLDALDLRNRELIARNSQLEGDNLDLDKQVSQWRNKHEEVLTELEDREQEHVKYELEVNDKLTHFAQLKKDAERLHRSKYKLPHFHLHFT